MLHVWDFLREFDDQFNNAHKNAIREEGRMGYEDLLSILPGRIDAHPRLIVHFLYGLPDWFLVAVDRAFTDQFTSSTIPVGVCRLVVHPKDYSFCIRNGDRPRKTFKP